MTMRPYCPRDFASYCVDYFSRGLTFRFGGGLWRVWTPRGGTKGFPSPDEHPPPSPPVRQGDSASLPSLFHLATSKIPSAPQGAVYLDVFGTSCDLDYGSLVYPNVWHNWGCLFFIFCSVRGLSSALCRFPLLTLIRHSGSGFGQIHAPYRLHHRLSILSSHPHYLSEALTLVISVFLFPKARCLPVTPPNKPLTEPVLQYYFRSFIYMSLLPRHHDLHLRDITDTLY